MTITPEEIAAKLIESIAAERASVANEHTTLRAELSRVTAERDYEAGEHTRLRAELARVEAEKDRLAIEVREAMRVAGYVEWAIDENMRRLYAQAALFLTLPPMERGRGNERVR